MSNIIFIMIPVLSISALVFVWIFQFIFRFDYGRRLSHRLCDIRRGKVEKFIFRCVRFKVYGIKDSPLLPNQSMCFRASKSEMYKLVDKLSDFYVVFEGVDTGIKDIVKVTSRDYIDFDIGSIYKAVCEVTVSSNSWLHKSSFKNIYGHVTENFLVKGYTVNKSVSEITEDVLGEDLLRYIHQLYSKSPDEFGQYDFIVTDFINYFKLKRVLVESEWYANKFGWV